MSHNKSHGQSFPRYLFWTKIIYIYNDTCSFSFDKRKWNVYTSPPGQLGVIVAGLCEAEVGLSLVHIWSRNLLQYFYDQIRINALHISASYSTQISEHANDIGCAQVSIFHPEVQFIYTLFLLNATVNHCGFSHNVWTAPLKQYVKVDQLTAICSLWLDNPSAASIWPFTRLSTWTHGTWMWEPPIFIHKRPCSIFFCKNKKIYFILFIY